MPHELKLAMIQMHVAGGNKQQNLAHAEELLASCGRAGARIALLPEVMNVGWTNPSCSTEADAIPDGETSRRLSQAAIAHSLYICAGLAERAGERIYNSAVLINPEGMVVGIHRKLNELPIGHEYYSQGDRLTVCRTELGTIGIMICADATARDHVLSRSLCYMGADIILSPSSWAVPADHDNRLEPYGKTWRDAYVPVAKEFGVWIAGVSDVGEISAGPWAGRKCIGCSLAIDPDGNEAAIGPYGANAETIMYVPLKIRPRPARGGGWDRYWETH